MIELDTRSAFDFYQSIAHRLPGNTAFADIGKRAQKAGDLLSIAEHHDVFVFDAFGVLNVGHTAIAGASECVAQLRALGKKVFVLTNGASLALSRITVKYKDFGIHFKPEEVISSRHCAEQAIAEASPLWSSGTRWGAITAGLSTLSELPVLAIELDYKQNDYDRVDAFLFLSSSKWSALQQAMLSKSLQLNPRPVVVANPDVVAPRESGFSPEPGYFMHCILDQFESEGRKLNVEFYGKPYPAVYSELERRLAPDISRHRIAMLGDTLHTDVLGANVQGWSSILVSDHGLFRGYDVQPFIEQSGIIPDYIIPSIGAV